jgi:hypothetical protein
MYILINLQHQIKENKNILAQGEVNERLLQSLLLIMRHEMKICGGVDAEFHAFISLAIDGGELLASYPGCFTGESAPSTHSIGGWVGSRVSQDSGEKISAPC